MKNNLLFLTFLFGFHHLFWHQLLGLNLVVFALAAILLHYSQRGFQGFHLREAFFGVCFLISAVAVLMVNSAVSQLVCIVSFTTYLGFLKLRQSSALENFMNGFYGFFGWRESILPERLFREGKKRPAGVLYTRLALLPVLIFVFYLIMFSAGNSIFRGWTNTVFGRFIDFLETVSWPYFLFLLLGVFVVRWFFQRDSKSLFSISPNSNLLREKPIKSPGFQFFGLRYEYITALMIFGLLNVLFAAVNFIDVRWVWFQFYVPADFSLKEFVHDGVGYLIATLLLSMGLIFYFFRKNLNFYPNSRPLKVLGIVWLAQNAILAISVVLRTAHYIGFHGLASGRIGLLVFLALVIFGLITLFVKIAYRKNNAFILRANSTFALALFVACSTINWDGIIARVNLNHAMANEIDVNNYLNLNPQVYPTIFANLDKVEKQIRQHNHNAVRWIAFSDVDAFREALMERSQWYLNRRAGVNPIYSWNLADQQAVEELERILK